MIVKYSPIQLITIWMLCNFRFADSFVVKSLGRRFLQLNRRCAMNLEKAIPFPPSRLLGKQVIVLAGATSVGKSAVAAELCKIIDAEIVLADCVQVRNLTTKMLSEYSRERKLKVCLDQGILCETFFESSCGFAGVNVVIAFTLLEL
jgi:hypothetical protein